MPSPFKSLLEFPGFLVLACSLSTLLFVAFILCGCIQRQLHPSATSRGFDKRALNFIPKLVFSQASMSASRDHKLEDCAICLSQFEEGEELRVLPQCGHGYHVICIDKWLGSQSTCPLCRQTPLSDPDTC